MTTLCRMLHRGASPVDVANRAEDMWKRSVGPGTGNHEKSYVPGMNQAKRFQSAFLQKSQEWVGDQQQAKDV